MPKVVPAAWETVAGLVPVEELMELVELAPPVEVDELLLDVVELTTAGITVVLYELQVALGDKVQSSAMQTLWS